MQGTAEYQSENNGQIYHGGQIAQHAVMYPVIGNTRLISLYSTRIWRGTDAIDDPVERDTISRYHESAEVLDSPLERGYGDFLFEDVAVDSEQYNWLQEELASPETTGADNVIGIRYESPAGDNLLLNSLLPLIDRPDTPVNLVFNGHSHLWNRFQSDNGVSYIETSNVGNSYGARHELSADGPRPVPDPDSRWDSGNYQEYGAAGGLEPIVPTVNPQMAANDPSQPAPYVASNQYSVFTGFDSETGVLSSWIFDGSQENPEIILLDEFDIHGDATVRPGAGGEPAGGSAPSSVEGALNGSSAMGSAELFGARQEVADTGSPAADTPTLLTTRSSGNASLVW